MRLFHEAAWLLSNLLSVRFAILTLLTAPTTARQGQTQSPWRPLKPFEPRPTCPFPVDNKTGLGGDPPPPSIPWTHRPYCALLASSTSGNNNNCDKQKQCVFSSSAFNLGAGIAVITHPSVAAHLSDAVSDASVAWPARHHLSGLFAPAPPPSSKTTTTTTTTPPVAPYEVRDVPAKGKGVVATRNIEEFTVLMTGFPALVVHDDFFPHRSADDSRVAPPPPESWGMYERALAQLGDRDRVLGLAKSGTKVGHVAEDIMRMNAFGVVLGDVKHKALYPEVSRINHGCDPNAMGRLNPRTLALDVIATRDIPTGEEIQISYIPLGLPHSHRQQALQLWGFTCACSLCTAPSSVREISDAHRQRLAEIQYLLNDESTLTHATLVDLASELEYIASRERLVQRMGEFHNGLMTAFLEYGDGERALYHARIASRYCDATADVQGPSCSNLRMNIGMLEGWLEGRRVVEDWT